MDFQFTTTDLTLTRAVAQGGCGLSVAEASGITSAQTNLAYVFHYHTGYHGSGDAHYVYIRQEGSSQVVGLSRVFITGKNAGKASNDGRLKAAWVADAERVVTANQALFLKIAEGQ